jgi:hypothetical protein
VFKRFGHFIADLIPSTTVARIHEFAAAIAAPGDKIKHLADVFKSLSPAAKVAVIAIGGITAALAAMFAAAFPLSATVLAIVAVGVAFDEAYKHSAKFRDIVGSVGDWIKTKLVPAVESFATRIEPTLAQVGATFKRVFGDIVVIIGQVVRTGVFLWQHFGQTILTVVSNEFGGALRIVKEILGNIGAAFDILKDVLTGKWGAAWGALKTIVSNSFDIFKTMFVTLGKDIGAIWEGIWRNIEKITLEGISAALGPLKSVVGTFTGLLGAVGIHVGNPVSGLQKTITGMIAGIDAKQAAHDMANAVARNAAAALKAKTTDPAIAQVSKDLGKKVSDSVVSGVTTGAVTGAANVATGATDAAVKNAQEQLGTMRQNLRQMIIDNAIQINQSVAQAKQNLEGIASNLAGQIGQIIDQPFVVAQTKLQDATDKMTLFFDRKNAVLSQQATTLNLTMQRYSIRFDAENQKLDLQSSRLQQQQSMLGLLNDKLNLSRMREEVALPGGKQLSMNPREALSQLRQLAAGANAITKPAIDQFILQYQQALLQVGQDKIGVRQGAISLREKEFSGPLQVRQQRIAFQQAELAARQQAQTIRLQLRGEVLRVAQDVANHVKIVATRSIADWAAALASHAITLKEFNRRIAGLLAADHVSYRKAGELLGSAFASGFQENVKGILDQAHALAVGPRRPGTGQEPTITRPEIVAAKDALKVARAQHSIASKSLSIQKKQAKDATKTQQNTQALNAVKLGPTATSLERNKGNASKAARALSGTTG